MTSFNNLKKMRTVLSDLQAQRDAAASTYLGLAKDCADLEALVARMTAREGSAVGPTGPECPRDDQGQSEPAEGTVTIGYPLDIDISGATNHVERVRLLAERLPDSIFDIKAAALWLVEIGASKGSPRSLESGLYGKLGNRDDFVKLSARTYQFVDYGGEVIPFGAPAHSD